MAVWSIAALTAAHRSLYETRFGDSMSLASNSPARDCGACMRLLDLTLDTAARNLALDEALLDEAEENATPREVLRLWEFPEFAVIVGRSSSVSQEVDAEYCAKKGMPILRRCSGGASVLVGPGCLMYSLVLSYELRPALRMIEETHAFVLERLAKCLDPLCPGEISHRGISDLTLRDRKVSGNSLRCKRGHLLYHGTLLYDFPLELIGSCLRTPPRQPDYRAGRNHLNFVANLPATVVQLRAMLEQGWNAERTKDDWPLENTLLLAQQRYDQTSWNLRRE
jgi:lipoate-protein ligase A